MRFLLVVKQKRNVDAFLGTVRCLLDRGHTVTLAIQERDEKTFARLADTVNQPHFRVTGCPAVRADKWADVASLSRRLNDCIHYLRPTMRSATKLRARVVHRLRHDLQFEASTESIVNGLLNIPDDQVERLDAVLKMAERALPSDPLFDEFLAAERPDVLLVSPLVHFGPAQADLISSAHRLGIPAWMLLYSWDNLSTKGALHRWPDRMFVWNEQQRKEAGLLHGFPSDRVIVVGAPRFDTFFSLRSGMNREQFHEPLKLDPQKPTLLYVCSSRFVSESELPFVRRWLNELRGAGSDLLRSCNVVVRPHPDIPLLPPDCRMTRHRWPAMPNLIARTARPFDDDSRAVVLQTDFTTPQGLYESIAHSTAVVGLNTTAELEAGIVGRPVFTIVADDQVVDGQSSTIHFHYLTTEHGGFVSVAATFGHHVTQLEAALSKPPDVAAIRAFIEAFLRPHGIDKPVAPLFAETLEGAAAMPDDQRAQPDRTAEHREAIAGNVVRAHSNQRVLRLVAGDSVPIHVHAAAIGQRHAINGVIPTSASVLAWVEHDVEFGDVVYDVGAGIGEYVLIAAKRRGATVVAFEPAYAAYAELCDNVLLNSCESLVVPVPLALAARDGLAEIRYQQGMPGAPGYMVRDDINWRVKHRGRNLPYFQPACLTRLDTAIDRYRLPEPHHLRVAEQVSALQVLTGAEGTLACRSLRTICLHAASEDESSVVELLGARGWTSRRLEKASADVQLVFRRTSNGD
jgi:FkbM family methyltransferase